LAEDNAVNQTLAVRLLNKWGHTVTVADNGKQALGLLGIAAEETPGPGANECKGDKVRRAKHGFDLVLMDVQMPEMDGLEATAVIREWEKAVGGHVPIVAMTAHAMKGDRERILEAGMDGYVPKPLRPQELLDVLEEVAGDVDSDQTTIEAAPSTSPGDVATATAQIFDAAAAMDRVDGDRELLQELIDIFLAECPKWLTDIHTAIGQGDAKTLRRAAHTVKGSAGAFGAAAVFSSAQRLETMGDHADLAHAADEAAGLTILLDKLKAELAAYRNTPTA
jgi:CheY-like chemotaxis protein